MAPLRMSLRNAIFVALFFTSYASGIRETVESYAEQAACSLPDVALIRRFESQMPSSRPRWFIEGMQIYAYEPTSYYWVKRHLTWAVMNDPAIFSEQTVASAMQTACRKWGAVSPFTFQQVSPSQKPDIRIKAVPRKQIHYAMESWQHFFYGEMDRRGATLYFATTTEFSDRNRKDWTNFRYKILLHLGFILGLGHSKVWGAVMWPGAKGVLHPAVQSPHDYNLTADDIAGIQKKYGPPTSSGTTTRPYDGRHGSSSGSVTTSTSGPLSSSRGTTRPYRGGRPWLPPSGTRPYRGRSSQPPCTTEPYFGEQNSPSSSSTSSDPEVSSSTSDSSSSEASSKDDDN